MNILEFRNVSKTYPGVKALDGISFCVEQGQVHVIIGENGAGKSTLIKVLTGVEQPDSGSEILIDDKITTMDIPLNALQKGIVAIYQDFSLFDNLTVAENIAMGQQVEKRRSFVDWKMIRKQARLALEKVNLNIELDELVGNISVAKKQLVAIARALVYDVKLLIMDEPTSCLSKGEVQHLFEIIRSLKAEGITILFVSHKMEEIFEIGDVISVLRDGQYKGTLPKEKAIPDDLIELMCGRKIIYKKYERRKLSDVILKVEGLSKKDNYKDINFELRRGEILGITGLVGAGRSEVALTLFGLNKADSGEITINGKPVSINSTHEAIEHKIGFVPENRLTEGLALTQSVKRNLLIAIIKTLQKGLFLDEAKMHKTSEEWMNKLNIRPGIPEMAANKLSGGNQQRVVLAKWLAISPEILIVDEPTAGIDVGAKEDLHRLLRELSDEGMSIIVVSSELPEIISISDRILVMKRGRIVAEFEDDVTQQQILNTAVM